MELAMLAPGFIFLIFFCVQAALFFYGKSVAIQAAREGVSQLRLAQDAAVYQNISGGVADNTESFATTVGREALLDPVATPSYDEQAGRVSMTVRGHAITLVPFLQLNITETAHGPVERFEGDQP
ncbi:TadE family protein [Knoellia koreensis]